MFIRNTVAALIFGAVTIGAGSAQAQATYDMSLVTCADYGDMPVNAKRDFAAWMSGWFNQKGGNTEIDLKIYHANFSSVHKWCSTHPTALVKATIEEASRSPKPMTPGPSAVDTAKITCQDFVSSDMDEQYLIQAWVGGWLHAEKNVTRIDIKNLTANEKVAHDYCRKHKKDNFVAAMRKLWK